eukprot:11814473-Alexandrium_andersonii.AAC.1
MTGAQLSPLNPRLARWRNTVNIANVAAVVFQLSAHHLSHGPSLEVSRFFVWPAACAATLVCCALVGASFFWSCPCGAAQQHWTAMLVGAFGNCVYWSIICRVVNLLDVVLNVGHRATGVTSPTVLQIRGRMIR